MNFQRLQGVRLHPTLLNVWTKKKNGKIFVLKEDGQKVQVTDNNQLIGYQFSPSAKCSAQYLEESKEMCITSTLSQVSPSSHNFSDPGETYVKEI